MAGRVYYQCKEHWWEVVKEWSTAVYYSGLIVASVVALYAELRVPEILLGLGMTLLPVGHLVVELIRRENIQYTLVEIDGEAYVSRRERKLNPFRAFPWREDSDPKDNKTLTSEGNVLSDFIGFERIHVRFGQMTSFVGMRVPKEFVDMYRLKAPKEEKEEIEDPTILKIREVRKMIEGGIMDRTEGLVWLRELLAAQ